MRDKCFMSRVFIVQIRCCNATITLPHTVHAKYEVLWSNTAKFTIYFTRSVSLSKYNVTKYSATYQYSTRLYILLRIAVYQFSRYSLNTTS